MLVVAAMLLTWHGVLISTPHDHADTAVPQEELACSASSPSSQTSHLYGSGRLLAPHPCQACLAGSAPADSFGGVGAETLADGESIVATVSTDLRSRFHAHLPLLRGPPPRT